MLTLNDGRAELWQWDTGRTLAVDADPNAVGFAHADKYAVINIVDEKACLEALSKQPNLNRLEQEKLDQDYIVKHLKAVLDE